MKSTSQHRTKQMEPSVNPDVLTEYGFMALKYGCQAEPTDLHHMLYCRNKLEDCVTLINPTVVSLPQTQPDLFLVEN